MKDISQELRSYLPCHPIIVVKDLVHHNYFGTKNIRTFVFEENCSNTLHLEVHAQVRYLSKNLGQNISLWEGTGKGNVQTQHSHDKFFVIKIIISSIEGKYLYSNLSLKYVFHEKCF